MARGKSINLILFVPLLRWWVIRKVTKKRVARHERITHGAIDVSKSFLSLTAELVIFPFSSPCYFFPVPENTRTLIHIIS